METLTKEEFLQNKEMLFMHVADGAVFIHPTDTIYGLGCDATNELAVEKIRELKGRSSKPFSIIAPSKEWILENCNVEGKALEWVDKLPGPYTLILNIRNDRVLAPNVAPGLTTIGVRIPNHWISEVVRELDMPIITTSANKVGKDFMTSLEDLDPDIKTHINMIIYEGEKEVRPSKIINLADETKPSVIER